MEDFTLYARACSSQGDCTGCPMATVKAVDVSCMDFVKQFPEKAYAVCKKMLEEPHTYYNEYCNRFPQSGLSMPEVALAFCRKAMFDGSFECNTNDEISCTRCWNEPYQGEFTTDDFSDTSEDIMDIY